jgi:sec-independent protein translocase protein TatA
MFGIGTQEMMVILVIVLVLFGGSKLPELAKGLGRSMKEFKKGLDTPEESAAPTAATAATAAGNGQLLCATCSKSLEPGWTHCPHCGAGTTTGSARGA